MITGRDFIITSLQSWDIAIGSNAKDIAKEISRHNRVLYVNTPVDMLNYFGMEAIQQIRKEYDATRYMRDASQIYSGCKDLNEYLQKRIADRKEQAQSVKKRNDTLSKKPKGFRL